MILDNIRALCANERISIARLERETGIANGTVAKWKRSVPKIDTVRKVAEYFGCGVDELIRGE